MSRSGATATSASTSPLAFTKHMTVVAHRNRAVAHVLRIGPVLATLMASTGAASAQDCTAPIDFMALPMPSGSDPIEVAMEQAYPGLDLDVAQARVVLPDGQTLPALPARDVPPSERLEGTTLGDQFVDAYPLEFNLESRQTPWFDPGRNRDEALMRALWFDEEAAARASLARVEYSGTNVEADFLITTKHCAHLQAAYALAEIAELGPSMDPFFHNPGGSFSWRVIAGTERLSVHSFGAAIDLNADLGGYWQ